MPLTNREWLLARRPHGIPQANDYQFHEHPIGAPGTGEVLVRVLYISMDPAIRGWMDEGGNYFPPIPLGAPVTALIVGQVVESNAAALKSGMLVSGLGSWSEYVVAPAASFHPLPSDVSSRDLPFFLHPLGHVGLTAYYGLFDIGAMQPGDQLLVSGASGAVGSLVAQMAKLSGASRVVGITGGTAKCTRAIERYGYDACIDYQACGDLSAAIARELPEGLDLFFENVGGKALEAALNNLAKGARIALCGMISTYNATDPEPGPPNLWNLLVKTARIHGFLVSDFLSSPKSALAAAEIGAWIEQDSLSFDIDIRDGLKQAPAVFNLLFSGGNEGKLMVKVAEPQILGH